MSHIPDMAEAVDPPSIVYWKPNSRGNLSFTVHTARGRASVSVHPRYYRYGGYDRAGRKFTVTWFVDSRYPDGAALRHYSHGDRVYDTMDEAQRAALHAFGCIDGSRGIDYDITNLSVPPEPRAKALKEPGGAI